jgi:membrane-associated phospholipid phosphatase
MQATHLQNPRHKLAPRWLNILLIVVPLILFVGIYLVVRNHAIQQWDESVILSIQNYTTPFLDGLFRFITNSGGNGRVFILVPVLILFWRAGLKLEAWTLTGAALIGQLITWAFKYSVNRPRPNVIEDLVLPTDPSFPSGHALGSAVLFGWLAVWLWRQEYRKSAALLVVWAFLVAFSRVYFGVHHPSDVLASLTLAIPWLTIVFMIYDRQKRNSNE